jgi:predicted adenine nucleotide alpha hydrolase (AANH) superfamily ATPase
MRVLLHTCCGPCLTAVAERLLSEGHKIVVFFYNPNIYPYEEYNRRLEAVLKVVEWFKINVIQYVYDTERWYSEIRGLEHEPEGGARCSVCFRLRLKTTYEYLINCLQKEHPEHPYYCDKFTTTLTISSYKPAEIINNIGKKVGGDKFLGYNFSENNGYLRSVQLSKELGLYRQKYCGCEFSLKERKRIRTG